MSGLYLFNKNLQLQSTILSSELLENSQQMELNGLITARAVLKYKEGLEHFYYFGQKEKNNFWLYKIRNFKIENGNIEFEGIHILFDDLKGCVVRDIKPRNATAINTINQILNETGWRVNLSTATKITSSNFYYKNTLTAFNDALKIWDCEFIPKIKFVNGIITEKNIELYDRISKDYGKWFEYGDKLLTVIAEVDKDISTAFIGLGRGEETEKGGFGRKIKFDKISWDTRTGNPANKPLGQDYVEIEFATNFFGYSNGRPKIEIVEFSDIEDPEKLLEATYQYAIENARPKIQFKAKTISNETVELGEICTISHSGLKIKYKTRIYKIKKDFLNPKIVDYEFGDRVLISQGERIKLENFKKHQNEEQLESRLQTVLNQVTKSYFNEDGYNYELKVDNEYNLPAGFYSFNKPINENPTKVVYMGAGKVLIANDKKPNGEWNFKTAITADGISGNEIVTNSITVNKLSADVGQSLDLSSNVSINAKVENVKSEVNTRIDSFSNDVNTSFNDVTVLVTETNKSLSEYKLKSDEITSKVEEIKETISNIDNNISYNLIEGTRDFLGTWVNSWSWKDGGEEQGFKVKYTLNRWMGLSKEISIEAGKTYTFSAYIKRSVAGEVYLYLLRNGTNVRLSATTTTFRNVDNNYRRVHFTFRAVENGVLLPRFERGDDKGVLAIYGYCLCEGKNRNWIPHIKEIQERFDTTEIERNISNITQTQENITQEVASFKEIQTTKNTKLEQDIAKISTKANEITSSVESVRSSVTGVRNDVNSVRGDVNSLRTSQNTKNTQIDREISSIKQKSNEITSSVTSLRNDVTTGLSQITQKSNEIDLRVESVSNLVTETENKLGENLCTDGSTKKTGNDLYFNLSEPMKANVEYVVEFNLLKSSNPSVVKIYQNTLQNTSKIGVNKHRVKVTQDKTRLNIYPVSSTGEIVDVKVYKADSLIFVKDNLDKKVDSDKIITSINLSKENGVKIQGAKVDITGDLVVNALNGTSTKISGNKIQSGTITGSTLSGGTITGSEIIGSTITGNSKIKIGRNGYLVPLSNGLKIKSPSSENATGGVAIQMLGGGSDSGISIYEMPDFSNSTYYPTYAKTLLTVGGEINGAFRDSNTSYFGKAVMSNQYKEYPKTAKYRGQYYYRVSWIGLMSDSNNGTYAFHLDDGTGSTSLFGIRVNATESDRNLKENIRFCEKKALDVIEKLKFYSFDWRKDRNGNRKSHTDIGLIAQDVEKIDKSFVYKNGDTLAIDDFRLLNIALKSVQELSTENKNKDEVIEDLTKRIERLEKLCGK